MKATSSIKTLPMTCKTHFYNRDLIQRIDRTGEGIYRRNSFYHIIFLSTYVIYSCAVPGDSFDSNLEKLWPKAHYPGRGTEGWADVWRSEYLDAQSSGNIWEMMKSINLMPGVKSINIFVVSQPILTMWWSPNIALTFPAVRVLEYFLLKMKQIDTFWN